MRQDWCKWRLTAGVLAVFLLLGTLSASAQNAEPSLGQKYKTAMSLYEQEDYEGARKLLLEVKQTVERENLLLNPATKQEIDNRLAEIEKKIGARSAAPTETPAPLEPAQFTVDPAKLQRLEVAVARFNNAQILLRGRNYEEALRLFTEVKAEIADLPVGRDDRIRLDSNIAHCQERLAAATVPTPPPPEPTEWVEAEPAPAPAPEPVVDESEAMKRFEELAQDPEVLREKARREAALRSGGLWQRGADTGIFGDAVDADAVRVQLEEQEIRTKLSDGLVYMRERDFTKAEQKFLAAQLQVKYGEFSTPFKKKWLGEVQKYLDLNASKKAEYGKRAQQMKNRETAVKLQEDLIRMKQQQQRIKSRLMEQWITFCERGQYDDALVVLERMRVVDPEDPTIPVKIRQTTHKKLEAWRYKSLMTQHKQREYHFAGNIEQMIPWYPLSVYPDDWKELSDRRLKRMQKAQISEKPGDRRVRQQLEETILSFTFNDQPVMEALDFLQTLGNVNIVPDRSRFEDPGQTITLKLTNVSLETAIKLLTEQLGLQYVIRDGIVFISDDEGIRRPPVISTYDVRDLLADIPNFSGPTFELQNISSNRGGGGTGGGSGGGMSIFADDEEADQTEGFTSPEESLNDLIDLIRQVIEPGTWDEGSGNAIRGRQGSIVVTHTPETQALVQGLLEDLRETAALQVCIDIRFITITDNFLESIGFDITGAGNLAAQAPHYIDSDGDGIPDTSMGVEYDRTILGGDWSILGGAIQTIGRGTDVPSARGLAGLGGLSLATSFLDDIEVNFILTAVQQSRRATLLNAPKLTMMNGQRAYIAISRQQNFVQDVTVEVSEGAVGYDPDIGTVQDGIVFDVRPTVSADRRYVRMDLRPSVAVVEDISEFETITAGIFGGAVIQLPVISVTVVRTTVSVPDGGTLLIGGLSFAFDNKQESGIPVLSKIPLLGKLFSRRGFAAEKENLVILVKPTIIIREEKEEEIK